MSIEHEVRISEKQRKLIMRALTTTVANNRRSTSGGLLSDAAPDDWMELIGVFAALNPHMMVADDQPEHAATIDRARTSGELKSTLAGSEVRALVTMADGVLDVGAHEHHEDRTPMHSYEPTREDAMAAFARSITLAARHRSGADCFKILPGGTDTHAPLTFTS